MIKIIERPASSVALVSGQPPHEPSRVKERLSRRRHYDRRQVAASPTQGHHKPGSWPRRFLFGVRRSRQSKHEQVLMPHLLIVSLLLALSLAGFGSPAEARTARARASGGAVPNLDIESGCRSLAHYDPGRTVNFDNCVKEERAARVEIAKSWRSVTADRREQCLYLVTPPALPSYISLQGCLTIAHDAEELAKKAQTGPSADPLRSGSREKGPRRAARARRLPNQPLQYPQP
jgi:hypothetical protein